MHRHSRLMRTVVSFAAILTSAVGTATEPGPQPVPAPPMVRLVPVSKPATRWYPSLAQGLDRVATSTDPLATARAAGFRVRDGLVQVVAECSAGRSVEVAGWLEGLGAMLVSVADTRVQAHVAPVMLPALAAHPDVRRVRRPIYLRTPEPPPSPAGLEASLTARTSEGVAAMNAVAWHAAGYRGQGIRVGIIDPGFGGYQDLLGTDLPPASRVKFKAFGAAQLDAANPHGTACAEIVTDIVPDVEQLYLALIQTDVDRSNALSWLAGAGVDVASMSAGYTATPNDGTGWSDIESWSSAGHLWFNAAGNERLGHWQGWWSDGDADDIHDFSQGSNIDYITYQGDLYWAPSGFEISAALVWNQWSRPSTDLDLYLVRWDGSSQNVSVVAQSEDYQTGGADQYPVEQIDFETTQAGYYGFAIQRASGGTGVQMELFADLPLPLSLTAQVPDGSLISPADAPSAVAVAALDAVSPFPLEIYSSKGPANGPGGALSGGLLKPDLAGFANVSTASYGTRTASGYSFNGTSAACPHLAGAAALVWSANPGWSAAQVRSFLENRAVDMGQAGKDTDYGTGRVWLGAAPSACSAPGTPGSFTASSTSVSSGATYSLSWGAAASADGYEIQEATDPAFSSPTTLSQTATSLTRSHVVSAPTSYYYRVRATRACGSASAWVDTVTVIVGGGGGAAHPTYMVAGIAHAPGAAGSAWRSSLAVCNRSSSSTQLTLTYHHGSGSTRRSVTLAAGAIQEWNDVAVSLFGLGGSTSGAVEVVSNQPVTVTARTYNQGPAGTYGQFLPGVESYQALAYGQTGLLPQIKKSATFRTNVGFVNLGSAACSVRTRLYGASGAQLGSAVTSSVPGSGWYQENDIFARAGAPPATPAYAVVEVLAGSGRVWAYASVVDGGTGDPTTIPVIVE